MSIKIVFLYTEIADYFIQCCNAFANLDNEVHIIRYPINKEAPFEFEIHPSIKIYERPHYNAEAIIELINQINPDLICCSGWIDKDYLKVAKFFKGKITTVLALDTHYTGNIKQQVLVLASPFLLRNKFDAAWVPGSKQQRYAHKLGFKKIYTGFYCADVTKFKEISWLHNKTTRNKRFLYVGRYLPFKGIYQLWNAFVEFKKTDLNNCELWCCGTGEDWDKRIEHPFIKHLGFVQPNHMKKIMNEVDVFVMPSLYEPWGVVLHEMCAAGLPVIVSDKVASSELFANSKNGIIYESTSEIDLTKAFQYFSNLNDEKLDQMSKESIIAAEQLTPPIWSNTLLQMINELKK